MFLKAGAGPGDGVAVQGLLHREGLLRQVGPLAAEGPAGDRALEPRQDAGSLHRAVRAVADGDAPVQQGLPAVAGGGQPGAHPGLDDLDVVIQKDALGVDVEAQPGDAVQLIGAGDLAVDHAVAAVGPGMGGLGGLQGVQQPVQTGVPDGVGGGLQPVGMGVSDPFGQVLPAAQGQAGGGGVVGVGAAEQGGAGPQSPVPDDLDRSGPEQGVPLAGPPAGLHKGLQIGKGGKVALLVDADGQLPLGRQLLIGLVHLRPGDGAEDAVVVGLAAGDALGVQGPAGGADHLFQGIFAGGGDGGVDRVHGVVEEAAVRLAAGHPDPAARRLGRAGGDPQQLQGPAVHHQTVAAGPHRADRDLGGDGVQVVPVGHPAGVREQVLVPAAADQPGVPLAGVPGQEGAHALQHLRQAAGVLRQLGHLEQIAVFHQVHMAVVEAAADKLAAQVHQFVPGAALGQGTGVRARKGEAAVLDDKSLGQGQRAGVDRAVVIDRFHGFSPALWVGSFGVIIAAPGPKVNALGAERKKMFQDIDTMSELWYSIDTDTMSE